MYRAHQAHEAAAVQRVLANPKGAAAPEADQAEVMQLLQDQGLAGAPAPTPRNNRRRAPQVPPEAESEVIQSSPKKGRPARARRRGGFDKKQWLKHPHTDAITEDQVHQLIKGFEPGESNRPNITQSTGDMDQAMRLVEYLSGIGGRARTKDYAGPLHYASPYPSLVSGNTKQSLMHSIAHEYGIPVSTQTRCESTKQCFSHKNDAGTITRLQETGIQNYVPQAAILEGAHGRRYFPQDPKEHQQCVG